ncbi:hypothetical protein [Fictibacillus terranigra]|uniref:Uncharacterized protein n=1 Tax=Fictibacillus terranigra TaxID=3058424 RepID=A0ABT8E601_9BACL|nr:hypothetical protein [Fictibacillus sp. CENA-BCM004]MDN4073333.1 hypothetical protein [Fictibacillus sp. CENA-BCM004]
MVAIFRKDKTKTIFYLKLLYLQMKYYMCIHIKKIKTILIEETNLERMTTVDSTAEELSDKYGLKDAPTENIPEDVTGIKFDSEEELAIFLENVYPTTSTNSATCSTVCTTASTTTQFLIFRLNHTLRCGFFWK